MIEPDGQVGDSFNLCNADATAFDALIAAGFDPTRVDPAHRQRATRVALLLGMLDQVESTNGQSDHAQTLIDVTVAKLRRQSREATSREDLSLCGADDDAFELLVAAKYDPSHVPGGVRPRAERQAALLGLLDVSDAQHAVDRERMVSITVARVQQTIHAQQSRMTLDTAARGRRFAWRELMSVAAVLLIGGAVLTPMANAIRDYNRRTSCQSNMMAAGVAFGTYANDYHDALPIAGPSEAGSEWWQVGNARNSNSANLFTIARTNYTTLNELSCAGNPQACRSKAEATEMDWRNLEQVSYSYQNLFANERSRWTQPHSVVVLADRSPLIPLAKSGLPIDPMSNSLNHGGRGQVMLFNDGRVEWAAGPVLANGDYIYLPRVVEETISKQPMPTKAKPLKGTESPGSPDDAFVGP